MEQENVEQKTSVIYSQSEQLPSDMPPPPFTPNPAPARPSSSKKILLIIGVLLGFALSGAGGYVLGLQRNKQGDDTNIALVNPTDSPFASEEPIPSGEPDTESNPSEEPTSTSNSVSVPSDWKKYIADDREFGVKTTMSMPPGFSFVFSGSEATIKSADSSELWEHSTSVYPDESGVSKNRYTGGSRREWYEKRLGERQQADKVVSVSEKPINSTTYLEVTVQMPNYTDQGVAAGTRNVYHYVYVQNGILHMIVPSSNKAYTSQAQIPTYIDKILASLTSVTTK